MKLDFVATWNLFRPVCLLILGLLVLAACDEFNFLETHEGKVIKVLDGDSIIIIQQGKEIRVRALESHVSGKRVTVEEFDRDQYGRIVGHVYIEDDWINGALVKQGYAYVYTRYAVSKKLFKYESQAEENNLGIWRLPESERIKPWDWRKMK